MRTLKVTLGVGAVTLLLATCSGWLASSHILGAGGDFYVGPEREKFVKFVQDRFGVSRRAAVAFMHRAGREQGARVIDRFNLPPGALVDFIEVDGSKGGKPDVRFLGTGRVFPALSAEGIAFWRLFERAARKHGWKQAYKAMRDLRRRGIVITPAWFGAGSQAAEGGARLVNTAATRATNIRVAIICARFPAWVDRSPQSDGDTDRFDGDTYYQPDPTHQLRNVDPNYDETHGWDFIDWYLDSPGGRLASNGGVPLGTEKQWNDTHPERAPASYDGPTVPKVQEYWYKRMFDLNFTGASNPAWAGSLHNYYWENSHGNINITGQRTDVYGWVESHHVLDRLPYPQGPNPVYMIQPGTPLIRPSQEIINADGVDREILRASLTQDKLTILYKHEFLVGSPPMPELWTEVEDAFNASGVDAPGWVRVKLDGHTTVIPDPYDKRRWTYVNDGWVFDSLDPDPDDQDEMDWNCWPGHHWRVTTAWGAGYTWQNGVPGYMPQDQGCGPLPNTLFTRNDVLTDAPGNRLKSFDYYCHDHFVDPDRGPYQIEHLYHNGYIDDIGGDSEPASARKARAYPFDCGVPEALGGSDRMQLGFFHYPNNDNDGDHSAGGMRADVNAAMADMGLTLAGTYDRIVYVFAGSGLGEGGGGSVGNWGTIIAHAGGGIVTVSEDVTLTTMAHEFGHTFGMRDLYDNDFYTNALSGTPPNPMKFECNGLGPYSVMAHGVRVDAWHLVKLGWLAPDRIVALTEDRPNAEIPAVEGVLREPIIYKLPGNPYYIVKNRDPSTWQEYFLVEYRYKTGSEYFGDPSKRGVYIYHIDERNIGGFQSAEPTLTVAMEQADAQFELENNLAHPMNDYPNAQVGPGNTDTDPFGVPASSGGADNFNFCQWDFQLDKWLAGDSNPPPAPTSYCHGRKDASGQHIQGGTDTDSFVRVLNIRTDGAIAYADIYVMPREIVVTGEDAWKDLVNGDGDPTNDPAWQGLENVPVLKLTLDNQENTGPGDVVHMSTGDVTIQQIRVVESGSSPNDGDVELVKVWADSDNNGDFDPTADTLLSSAPVNNQEALLQGLNYEVPLGEQRVLFITYDVSEVAQINPKVTLAADLPEPRYVWPEQPGTVQVRERLGEWEFGQPRFPIQSAAHEVIEGTDTVFISASNLAPAQVHPNDTLVPVLRMILSVDHDRAIVRRLRFVCNPDASHSPTDPQHDVAKAILWRDEDQDGEIDTSGDTKLGEAVFSSDQVLLFDGLDLTVAAGDNVHLLVSFDIAEDATLGNWLELEIPTWFDDNGTPADTSDDTYYVGLVDEDGGDNTYYQNPADPTDIRDVAHGADPATWKVVAGQDVVDTSGAPWKSNDFRVAPPSPPVLSDGTIAPLHGDKSDVFTLTVTYTSDAGIMPSFVRLVYRNINWDAGRANEVIEMHEADPSDKDVTDGKLYQVQITGLADWGTYKHYFWASDSYSEVYYYDPDGPDAGDPEGSYETAPRQAGEDATLADWLPGPIIGVQSVVRFTDDAWNDVDQYEEGRVTDPVTAAKIYIEVNDPDENEDAAAAETVTVTVTGSGGGADTEDVVLTETGPDTGLFRGELPTIGQAGAANDGWLNAIAGAGGQQITVVYNDKDDLPQPGAVDSSQDQATVVDTTPPDPVAPVVANSGTQGRKISVDWTGYDEAAQIDVAEYRVYIDTTDFNSVAGMTPVATVLAGTQTYEITGLEPDTDYYVAVTAVDEVPNENTNVATTHVHTEDTEPPTLLAQDPADGATSIALNATTVTAQVQDVGTGIDVADANAVEVTVTADNGSGPRNVAGTVNVSGGGPDGLDPVDITWTANEDWQWNDVVTVDLKVRDRANNELHVTWSFSVYTDRSAPIFVNNTPTPQPDAEQVPLDTEIVAEVQDQADAGMPASNLDLDSLTFEVTVTNSGNQTFNQVFTNADSDPNGPFTVEVIDASQVRIRYAHPGGWTWNDEVTVHLVIADNAGNALDQEWTFKVYTDRTPPAFVGGTPTPAHGANDVALDAQIVAEIQDQSDPGVPPSGLNLDTLTFEVTVTNHGNQTFNQSYTNADSDPNGPFTVTVIDGTHILITFTPASGWTWNDVVTVHLVISDNAGNELDQVWSFNALRDEAPPFVQARSPDRDARQVGLDAPIVVTMADDVSGVDTATVKFRIHVSNRGVTRIPWTDVTQDPNFTSSWSADYRQGTLRFQPADGWQYNDVVIVRVRASDRAGNEMDDWDQWTFYVLEDTDDLAIIDPDPADGATDVARDTNISFRVIDSVSGVDRDSIALQVDGVAVPANQLQITGDEHDYTVVYDPPEDYDYGQTVQCHAEARDIAGNSTSLDWSFTTEGDLNPPIITPVTPLADATDVPIDTNISARIADSETGVDEGTVAITVTAGGQPVAGDLNVTVENGSVLATFDPAQPLPYETEVQVHIEARDHGLPQPNLATLDYTFTTELAPRYNIIGRITDASGAAIAAVTVELSGDAQAAAITDGNGYYQFRDLLGGNYTVTPQKPGYEFTPQQRQIALDDDVDNADFTGREITYALSGQVTKNGRPLAGVTIAVDGQQTVTGNDGRWEIEGLKPGRYTVTPSLANHRFDPSSRTVRITDADVTGLDFEAIPLAYSIAGMVTDNAGNRLADVVITADGHRAITAETGRYQIGGVAAGTVQVQAEKQGWVFFWRDEQGVLHSGPRQVTVPPDQTGIDFVGFRSVRASFSAGIHLIGVPAYPRDPTPLAVFGTQLVARWDPTAQPPGYVTPATQPDSPFLRVLPGRGFFVRFSQDTDLEIPAEPVPTDRPFNMGLSPGWNMQANPFPSRLPFASLQVTSGEMRPFGYVYDAVRGQYLLISDQPGIGVARSYILPWEGIWLRALTTASLQISAPTETVQAKPAESLQLDLGSEGWWIPIQAQAGERMDTCCAVGVSTKGTSVALEKPPAMPNTVDVSVMSADGTRLARAVDGAARATHTWDLVVSTDIPNAEVVVSLPDLSQVPHDVTLTLTDMETGKTMYVRTMAGYRFKVGARGGVRRLRLTASPRTTAGLVVAAATAQQAGSKVVVTYSVTAPCRVNARVMNIAGRTVKTIAAGVQAGAGVNSLAWDGRNASGAPVPPGLYLIEIEGVAPSGQRARAVTQVRLGTR